MTSVLSIFILLNLFALPIWSQCADGTTVIHETDNVIRTGGNQIFSFSQTWVTGNYAGVWTVYAAAQITQNGSALHSNSDTKGSGSTAEVYWFDTLQTIGPGYFAEADQHRFTSPCGDNIYHSYTDRNLTVSRPVISPPSGTYGTNQWAMWYMNGLNSPDGFLTTATLTVTTNLGSCGGCTPTYLWANPDNSGAISFSSTNSTSTTITSQRASSGTLYDTSVNFSVDGFYADSKLSINLNTTHAFLTNSSNTYTDAGCADGYETAYSYSILDLWNYETAPVTVHEVNDSGYSNDFGPGLVGWYLCCFDNNYTWAPGEFSSAYMYENHFFDYLGFCSDVSWNPASTHPQSLNVPVFHVPQVFYVGSSSTSGVNTHSDTQNFYTDHGLVN